MTHHTKIEIAAEYLRDSIFFYRSGHYFSALHLAGASEEILGKTIKQLPEAVANVKLRNVAAFDVAVENQKHFDQLFGPVAQTEKTIQAAILEPKNSAKHHDGATGGTIDFDPQYEAGELILRAISNYRMVFPGAEEHFQYEEQDIAVHQLNKTWKSEPKPEA